MLKIIMIFLTLFTLNTKLFATGFGWYVSSFNWSTFKKDIAKEDFLSKIKSPLTSSQRQENLDMYIWDLATKPRMNNTKTDNLVIEESPMSDIEMYWADPLEYANKMLRKKGLWKNYFIYFREGKPYRVICPDWKMGFSPYFVLSPSDVKIFYRQINSLNKAKYPQEYREVLLHLEGVLLKTSASNDRGLVFFGHD